MRTVVLSVQQFSNFLHDICWIVPVCSCSASGFSARQWVLLRFYHSLLGTCLAKSVRNLRGCLNARRVSWWLAHGRSGSMLRSPGTLARAMPRTARWHQDGSRTQSWDESLSNIQKLLQISCSKMSKQSWKSSGVTNLEKHALRRSKVQES
jgi:hypothetical protein